MRKIALLLLTLLASCRTQRHAEVQSTLEIDSLAASAQYRTILEIDSLASQLTIDFDTLEIVIQRPTSTPNEPETLRLRATKGRLKNDKEQHKLQTEIYNRLDTTAYHQAAAETSSEHTITTRVYNPPNGTIVLIFTVLAIATAYILYHRATK